MSLYLMAKDVPVLEISQGKCRVIKESCCRSVCERTR